MNSRILRVIPFAVLTAVLVFPASSANAAASSVSRAPGSIKTTLQGAATAQYGSSAFADLAACLVEHNTLLTAIVVDDSGSLIYTDPTPEQRPFAVGAVLESLGELANPIHGTPPNVEASLAIFGEEFETIVPFGAVTGTHGQWLRDAADTQLRNREPIELMAWYTDYRVALEGAQTALNQRTAELGGQACSAILWFTDGKLDVPGGAHANEAAMASLCQAGGIVDSVRQSGIHLLTVALFSDDPNVPVGDRVTPEERRWLQAIAEGRAGNVTCGTDSGALGKYFSVENAAALVVEFAGIGTQISGGVSEFPGAESNVAGPITIRVDEAVGRVRIHYAANASGPIRLQLPNGTEIDLRNSSEYDDVSVTVQEINGIFNATITPQSGRLLPSGGWIIPAAGPNSETILLNAFRFWDIIFEVSAPEGIFLDQVNQIDIRRLRGMELDNPALYSQFGLEVRIAGEPMGQIVDHGNGIHSLAIDLTADSILNIDRTSSRLPITVTATAITNPQGLFLTQSSGTVPMFVPPGMPWVASELDFGMVSNREPGVAHLEVRGSSAGDTQLCLGEAAFEFLPEGVTGFEPLGDGNCFPIGTGENVAIPIELDTSTAQYDGRISGTLAVTTLSVDGTTNPSQMIVISGLLEREVNPLIFRFWIAGLVFIALLLWYLVAIIGRHLSERFVIGNRIHYAEVEVSGPPLMRSFSDKAQLITERDFESLNSSALRRSAPVIRGLEFHRVRKISNWWPLKSFELAVRASNSQVIIISADSVQRPKGKRTVTSPVITNKSYLVVSEAGQNTVRGIKLYILIADSKDLSLVEESARAHSYLQQHKWEIDQELGTRIPVQSTVGAPLNILKATEAFAPAPVGTDSGESNSWKEFSL